MIKAMLFFVLITVLFSLQFIYQHRFGVIFSSVYRFVQSWCYFLFSYRFFCSVNRFIRRWCLSLVLFMCQYYLLKSTCYYKQNFMFSLQISTEMVFQFNIIYVQVLPFKSTCYYKQTGGRTPSPTCVIDGATFKKTLVETIHGNMSPEVFFTFFLVFQQFLYFFSSHTKPFFLADAE